MKFDKIILIGFILSVFFNIYFYSQVKESQSENAEITKQKKAIEAQRDSALRVVKNLQFKADLIREELHNIVIPKPIYHAPTPVDRNITNDSIALLLSEYYGN